MSDSDAFNSDMFDDSDASASQKEGSDVEDWQGRLHAAVAKDEKKKKEEEKKRVMEEINKNRVTFNGSVETFLINDARADQRRREADAMNNLGDLLGGISESESDGEGTKGGRNDLDIMGIEGEEEIKMQREMKAQSLDPNKSLDGMELEVKTDYDKFGQMLSGRLIQIHNTTVVDGGVDENGVMFFQMFKEVVSTVLSKCCYPEDAKELSAVCSRVQLQMIEDEKKRKGIKIKKAAKKGPQLKKVADDDAFADFM